MLSNEKPKIIYDVQPMLCAGHVCNSILIAIQENRGDQIHPDLGGITYVQSITCYPPEEFAYEDGLVSLNFALRFDKTGEAFFCEADIVIKKSKDLRFLGTEREDVSIRLQRLGE